MSNSRIRLVHSNTESQSGIARWQFQHACQPDLFEEANKFRCILVPVSEMNLNTFRIALDRQAPKALIDTRPYPEFYSIYSSIEDAVEDFTNRNAVYVSSAISEMKRSELLWSELSALKSKIEEQIEHSEERPIFLLASTEFNFRFIAGEVKHYIEHEIANTRFEELRF